MIQFTKKEQVYRDLKQRIDQRFYLPGSRLPKETELAAELGISRKTLRPVLEQLAMENLIERIKGKGTFIRSSEEIRRKLLVVLTDSSDISNPFPYIMPGVQLAAESLNIHIESCSTLSLLSLPPRECADRILRNGFCGVIWFAGNFNGNEQLIQTMKMTGLPVLLPHASAKDQEITGFPAMGTDYGKVMEDGLRYLAAQGHFRVGNISLSDMRGVSAEHYFECIRSAGLDHSRELLVFADGTSKENVVSAAAKLMERKEPPTAIFCFSDFFALHIYEYLQTRKIRIPDDVAILSIGGQIGCNFLNPSLSAIDFGSLDIGRAAVQNMIEMIHGAKSWKDIPFQVTPHHITERESTKKQKIEEGIYYESSR